MFDPYHEWLGIPPEEQPPNHYRLLGIASFEGKAAVIQNAADRQMAHLRTFQTGKHAVESQRLLNEIAAAKVCLLDSRKKAVYDQALRARLVTRKPVAESLESGATVSSLALRQKRTDSHKRRGPSIVGIIGSGLAAVFVVFGAYAFLRGNTDKKEQAAAGTGAPPAPSGAGTTQAGPKTTEATPKPKLPPHLPDPPISTGGKPKPKPDPQKTDWKPDPEPAPSKPDQTTTTDPPKPPTYDPIPSSDHSESAQPPKKIPLPSAEVQAPVIRKVDEAYEPAKATDYTAKAALARKMLDEARGDDGNRAEQFVLTRRAAETACDAGDANLALEAVDAMDGVGFDIHPFAVKSRMLKKIITNTPVPNGKQISEVAAACLTFVRDAEGKDATSEAAEVLQAAQKKVAAAVDHADKLARSLKGKVARARNPNEQAEAAANFQEAVGILDSLKSARTELAACAKEVAEASRSQAEIQAAQEKLKAAPNDPEACLAVGSWQCFQKGDWADGLKLLAKGSDAGLKSLAAMELATKPSTAQEKVARGNAWWDAAETATGKARAAMLAKAAGYYREAMPDLSGLEGLKVQKRLDRLDEEPSQADRRDRGPKPPLAVAPFDEEAAKEHQSSWAKYLGVNVVETNSIGMKLVLIPPGEFQMGSTELHVRARLPTLQSIDARYAGHLYSELPEHRVRINNPFWLGMTQVTQAEYRRVMRANPSRFQGDPNRPVEQVSWDNAMEFCRRLSNSSGEKAAKRRYSLPTEAQWEYASRAGTTTDFYLGDFPSRQEEAWLVGDSGGQSHPVGQKKPNGWGLHDVHGNVWQWCEDWYAVDYYSNSPSDDPHGPSVGVERSVRGGTWKGEWQYARSPYRYSFTPNSQIDDLGFRVCVTVGAAASRQH
jgi:formylglycine-generating enzyme required for sulfatase activity